MTWYLTVERLVAINEALGGGVIDMNGVNSNAHRPESGVFGQEVFPDVWSKAAAYVHGIASTQYFADGNKRTAWVAANMFLEKNGYEMPFVSDIEADAFVQAVGQELWNTDDEPDLTVQRAAEWFHVKWETSRYGASRHYRLEYAFLAYDFDLEDGLEHADAGTFTVMYGGLGAIGVQLPTLEEAYPERFRLRVVGRLFWEPDSPETETLTISFVPEPDCPPVEFADYVLPLRRGPLSGHAAHSRSTYMPQVFSVPVAPVFTGPGRAAVEIRLGGVLVAELPFATMHTPGIPDDPEDYFLVGW